MDSRYLSQPWRFWKVTEYLPEAKPRADIQSPSKTWRVVAKISAIHLWAITYIFQNKMLRCDIEISHRNATMRYLYIANSLQTISSLDELLLGAIWKYSAARLAEYFHITPSNNLIIFNLKLVCTELAGSNRNYINHIFSGFLRGINPCTSAHGI